MNVDVFVPAEGWKINLGIKDASGIVGTTRDGDRTTIDYEGNLFGAMNIVTWADRVMVAAGRHVERYPTIARAYVVPEALIRVGTYDGESVVLDHPSVRPIVCEWLDIDDAALDEQLHAGTPVWA